MTIYIYGVYGSEAGHPARPGDEGRLVGRLEMPRADRAAALRAARQQFRDTRVLLVYRDFIAERDAEPD